MSSLTELNNYICNLIKDAINDTKYNIKKSGENFDGIAISIDFLQPIENRPNKRSKKLIIKFSQEFIDDNYPEKLTDIKEEIKRCMNNFDFQSSHLPEETPPEECYFFRSDFKLYSYKG